MYKLIFFFVFRDPSWRNEESHPSRSRTGSESSQQGSTSGRGEIRPCLILLRIAFRIPAVYLIFVSVS